MTEYLKMDHISKIYPNGVVALKDVQLSVKKGEIHALMGENGAGKSTLMKILFGLEESDNGDIFFDGLKQSITNPSQALELGIGMVNQHFMLIDNLRVYENVILGNEKSKAGFLDIKSSVDLVNEYSEKFNFELDPYAYVGDLSVSRKQKVELLKVLVRGTKVIILDEPTAVLTPQETAELFAQLSLLKHQGYTIIFITHKIAEVLEICDNISVLRKGHYIGSMPVAGATPEEISRMMIGRDVMLKVDREEMSLGKNRLSVRGVSAYNDFGVKCLDNVSFNVRSGEIVGIAGVEGNGQSELADVIFGMKKTFTGSILLNDKEVSLLSVQQRREQGIGYIPEDRIETGVATSLSIWENLTADKLDQVPVNKVGFLDNEMIRNRANELVQRFTILTNDVVNNVGSLSGGNMQKVVVAREMSSEPNVLIANQPTRGIDVGAQEFIWQELMEYKKSGNAVLLISADLNELLQLSDTVLVMLNGKIVARLENKFLSEDELGLYMLGVKSQKEA